MAPNLKPVALKVLTDIGIVKRSDEGDQVRYAFGDASKTIQTKLSFHNEGEIIIYSFPYFKIPKEARAKTMEYLNRKNFSSKIGCLEMDVRDGEVRYRTCIRHGDATAIESILSTFIGMHHSYFGDLIYPNLKKLRDPEDRTPMDVLIS